MREIPSLRLLLMAAMTFLLVVVVARVPIVDRIHGATTRLSGSTTRPDDVIWGTEIGGCRLGVKTQSFKFSAGASADIGVIIDNKTAQEIYFSLPVSNDNEFTITAVDDNGDRVGLTAYGSLVQTVSDAKLAGVPGGKTRETTVRINRIVDLTISGKYKVTLDLPCTIGSSVEKASHVNLKTEEFTMEITE